MKTPFSIVAAIVVLTGLVAGCAESGSSESRMKREPTGAPAQNPKKLSGNDTGGTGGPH